MVSTSSTNEPLDLKYPASLKNYLCTAFSSKYAVKELIPLSGGYCNYTYRAILSIPFKDGVREVTSIVAKYAAPHAAVSEDYKFDPIRLLFEAAAMRAAYTGVRAMTAIADEADPTFRFSKEQAVAIGENLGKFARTLHNWGKKGSQDGNGLREILLKNVEGRDMTLFAFYGRLVETIDMISEGGQEGERRPLEEYRNLFEIVARDMTQRILGNSECGIVHGDFWTGNVLVHVQHMSASETIDHNIKVHAHSHGTPSREVVQGMRVLDWEMSKVAPAFIDIGQMAAELWLPFHFKGNQRSLDMVDAYLASYFGGANQQVDLDTKCEAAIHFGTHLVVWPIRVSGWGSNKQIIESAEIGAMFIRKAREKDVPWLRNSALRRMFF